MKYLKKQMNKILTFLFLTFICSNGFGQNASELNEQSKKFIETQEFDKAEKYFRIAVNLVKIKNQEVEQVQKLT